MRGFCEEAILLLPKRETYNRSETYARQLKRSVDNIVLFFREYGITLNCFTTDEIAVELNPDVKWINSCVKEDLFFVKNNCEGLDKLPQGEDYPYAKEYEQARTKFPTKRGLSVEARFVIVNKRNKFIANNLIKKYKLVITFEQANNAYYNTKGKEGDGRIVIRVSDINLIPKVELSGFPIDTISILGHPKTVRPVYLWQET